MSVDDVQTEKRARGDRFDLRKEEHSEEIIAQEKHGQSCLVEALEAAMRFPPILSSHPVIYYSTLHRLHVLKVCLLHRLHLIQNKVMAYQEVHNHTSICQPEPLITKETSMAILS